MTAHSFPDIDAVSLFEAYDDRAVSKAKPAEPRVERKARRHNAPSFVVLFLGAVCASYFDPVVAIWSLALILGLLTIGLGVWHLVKIASRIIPAAALQAGFA